MLYFFNVVRGSDKVRDPEGTEFADLEEARAEAEQTARDLAADELRRGRPILAGWRVEVTDGHDKLLATVAFEAAVLKVPARPVASTGGGGLLPMRPRPDAANEAGFLEHYHRVSALFEETRHLAARVRSTFEEMRKQLAAID